MALILGPLTASRSSGLEAVSSWFDHGMNTSQVSRAGNVVAWAPGKREEQADRITVAATGPTDGYASVSIADDGEGQEPDDFAETFCSLNTGNKRSIPFVQGKHTMGGTGALRFCGAGRVHAHNLQLVVSRRNPVFASAGDQIPWGFTVVRRFPEQDNEKTPTFRFLAPNGSVLRFEADELAIFPLEPAERGRAEPYARAARWGTLTKLYEYIRATYITHSSDHSPKARLSLLRKLELRMPNAMLPVRLYECRPFRRVADQHPTMVLTGIMGRLHNLRNPSESLEWDGTPKSLEFRVDGQLIKVAVWAFKKPAGSWRGSHGVLFTLNGQTHATLPDSFFDRTDVGMNPLRKSLLVVVDCSCHQQHPRERSDDDEQGSSRGFVVRKADQGQARQGSERAPGVADAAQRALPLPGRHRRTGTPHRSGTAGHADTGEPGLGQAPHRRHRDLEPAQALRTHR